MAEGRKYANLSPDGKHQVLRWLGHAKTYIEQVLAPRCESIQSEVCVGINWVTREAEVFLEAKDRNYPDKPGWMFGTADLVCLLKTGELLIADWKTGGTDGAKEQLLSLGCGFQRSMPSGFVDVPGCYFPHPSYRPLITVCLQVDDDGVWPLESLISEAEVNNHWDAMRFATEDLTKAVANPGIHCTTLYCPHLAHCSAITSSVEGLATSDGKSPDNSPLLAPGSLRRRFQMTDNPGSPEEAGFTMAIVAAANRQAKYYTQAMKDYVDKGGRVVSGQYVWGPTNNGFRWKKR